MSNSPRSSRNSEQPPSRKSRKDEQGGRDPGMSDVFKRLITTLDSNNRLLQQNTETLTALQKDIVSYRPVELTDVKICANIQKTYQVTVELKCTFLKIVDIDTLTQRFEAEIFIQAKWQEPDLVNKESEDFDNFLVKNCWQPRLNIMNVDGELTLDRKTYCVKFNEPHYKYPVVMQLWRFKGFFNENLELESFPMDVQDLTISVSTEHSIKEVDLIEDQHALSAIDTKSFMDSQEWDVYKHVECMRDYTTVEYGTATVHPILQIQCRVSRKIGYFVWNIIVIMMLITCLTFATYAIIPSSADRLATTLTLFLTSMAFKLVVQQSLPTISYLTSLDIYVLASLIFLGLQAAQNALLLAISRRMSPEDLDSWDRWSIVTLVIVVILFHIVFVVVINRTATSRRRQMEKKDIFYMFRQGYLKKYGVIPNSAAVAVVNAPPQTPSVN